MLRTVAVTILAIVPHCFASRDVLIAAERTPEAAFIIEGMCANLRALERGVVRIQHDFFEGGQSTPRAATLHYFLAFDRPEGLLRHDSDEGMTVQWIIGREYNLHHQAHGSRPTHVRKLPSDHPCPTGTPHLFDIRSLGAGGIANFMIGGDLTRLEAAWSQMPLAIVDPAADIATIITTRPLENSDRVSQSTWMIDQVHGFTPVSRTSIVTVGNDTDAPPIVLQETTAQWERHGDIYVPTAVTYNETDPYRKRHMEFRLTWESVNEPIDESLFTIEGMNLPEGTKIVDARSGQNLIVGKVGEEVFVPTASSAPVSDRMGTVLLTISLLALAAAVVIAWRRGRNQQA